MADIKGVEIMSLGTWNGNKITEETFSQVLEAFADTKEFASVPLKLGHNEEQKLLVEDGLPAAGWVSAIYRQGAKLFADFTDIPAKIYELLKRKAYRKVSVELFCGYKFKEKEYPCLLGAVALLGSDLPAMATLNDIMSNYGVKAKSFATGENTGIINRTITYDIGETTMAEPSDKEVAALKLQLEAQQKQLQSMDEQVKSFKKEKEDLETYKASTEKKIAELETDKQKLAVETYCLDLSKKDLLSPSMKPLVEALLGGATKKFSIDGKDLEGKEVVEQLLTLAKEVFKINKTEQTEAGKKDEKTTDALAEKIKDLMGKEKLSYGDAYKRIMKQSA